MTTPSTINLLRILFVVATSSVAGMIGAERSGSFFAGFAVGAVFSLGMVLVDRLMHGFTLRAFSSATLGLGIGLVFATLLRSSHVLLFLPLEWQWIIGLAVYAAFGYLGMMLAMRANRDEFSLLIPYVRFTRQSTQDSPVVLDSNVIIDGRVADLCATGFLSGELIVPRFVLDELQRLADSDDGLRRERGRRGLEHLERLRREPALTLEISDAGGGAGEGNLPIDLRLLRLARSLGARVLSNDVNFAKAARLQNVTVLSLHDLARALRPALAAGDELDLHLIKEGRDAHQAVGYLPDGTMIVVNHGRERLGQTVPVTVSGTVQTSAGRLIFAELRGGGANGQANGGAASAAAAAEKPGRVSPQAPAPGASPRRNGG